MFADNQVSILVIVQSYYARFLVVAVLWRELVQMISVHNCIALHLVVVFFVLEVVHWWPSSSDVIVGLKSSWDNWNLILSLDFDLVGIDLTAGSTGNIHLWLTEIFFSDSIDSIHGTWLEMWIWAVSENADMLFKFLDFGLIHSYLSLLWLSILDDRLQIFVKDFILISLSFDIGL